MDLIPKKVQQRDKVLQQLNTRDVYDLYVHVCNLPDVQWVVDEECGYCPDRALSAALHDWMDELNQPLQAGEVVTPVRVLMG